MNGLSYDPVVVSHDLRSSGHFEVDDITWAYGISSTYSEDQYIVEGIQLRDGLPKAYIGDVVFFSEFFNYIRCSCGILLTVAMYRF